VCLVAAMADSVDTATEIGDNKSQTHGELQNLNIACILIE